MKQKIAESRNDTRLRPLSCLTKASQVLLQNVGVEVRLRQMRLSIETSGEYLLLISKHSNAVISRRYCALDFFDSNRKLFNGMQFVSLPEDKSLLSKILVPLPFDHFDKTNLAKIYFISYHKLSSICAAYIN